jgi:hypothetical protein
MEEEYKYHYVICRHTGFVEFLLLQMYIHEVPSLNFGLGVLVILTKVVCDFICVSGHSTLK